MIKELYQITQSEISINITQSNIDSIRKKSIVKSGCRVYDNGFIGISGTFGQPTEDTWNEAEKNLELKVSYKYEPIKERKRIRKSCLDILTDEQIINNTELLLSQLRKEFPDFIFSNKINYYTTKEILSNDAGLYFENTDSGLMIMIIFKTTDSVSVFDGEICITSRDFDVDKILENAKNQLNGYRNKVDIKGKENLPVAMLFSTVNDKLLESLNGELLGNKISVFAKSLGQKIFSGNFSVTVNRTDSRFGKCFFDSEGNTLENDSIYLIENGTILRGYTDKKQSDLFGFDNTACAGGEYDDIPSLRQFSGYEIEAVPSDKTIEELSDGKEYILLDIAGGGDWTSDCDFASPVQLGYLMKGTKVIGRLPEFNVSGNLYNIFGKDFIGYSKDTSYSGENLLFTKMKISI